ncbi:hypothetical protein TGMAS_360640 [Toxoplasma gondii MAS]|uniref:Uncharacterized protein n=1 Tax=Toxoplasma gondii MAS TaxID=943118 RepID=A0A086PT31_TOXGO|nr:hypothetical protein TGMAS_360640 [Toxoplasma gondii MAS]
MFFHPNAKQREGETERRGSGREWKLEAEKEPRSGERKKQSKRRECSTKRAHAKPTLDLPPPDVDGGLHCSSRKCLLLPFHCFFALEAVAQLRFLQEVERESLSHLTSQLECDAYACAASLFNDKSGVSDGCALLYKKSILEVVRTHAFHFASLVDDFFPNQKAARDHVGESGGEPLNLRPSLKT